MSAHSPAEQQDPDNLTGKTIDDFYARLRALLYLAESQVVHAKENQEKSIEANLSAKQNALAAYNSDASNVREKAKALHAFSEAESRSRFLSISHEEVLLEIIFVSIFSAFDAYVRHLLRHLYTTTPHLLHQLESREISLSDLLNSTKEDVIEELLDSDIDAMLRKSYIELFTKLEKRFSVSTLRNFSAWRMFVECSQRRNLLTHCAGAVNGQYLSVCKEAGTSLSEDLAVGTKLSVSMEYLRQSIQIVSEVGVKLGQVLWRASNDDSVRAADTHLGNILFEVLKLEEWALSLSLGEFAFELSRRKNQNLRADKTLKIILLNHAQAAKWSGDSKAAIKLLNSVDWSGSLPELRLAEVVLREDFDAAKEIMLKIGADSELCPIHGYFGWPIFRDFRATDQFRTAFKSIFGVDFLDEVKRVNNDDLDSEGD